MKNNFNLLSAEFAQRVVKVRKEYWMISLSYTMVRAYVQCDNARA